MFLVEVSVFLDCTFNVLLPHRYDSYFETKAEVLLNSLGPHSLSVLPLQRRTLHGLPAKKWARKVCRMRTWRSPVKMETRWQRLDHSLSLNMSRRNKLPNRGSPAGQVQCCSNRGGKPAMRPLLEHVSCRVMKSGLVVFTDRWPLTSVRSGAATYRRRCDVRLLLLLA